MDFMGVTIGFGRGVDGFAVGCGFAVDLFQGWDDCSNYDGNRDDHGNYRLNW